MIVTSCSAFFIMAEQIQHLHVTYNDIHNLIRENTPKIAIEFNPDLLIAIGLFAFSRYQPVLNYHLFRWGVSYCQVFAHSFRNLTVYSFRGFFPARVMVSWW